MKPAVYVAFLRGINVGGNTLVSMAKLKSAFSALGFKKVQTILASGNVVFEATEKNPKTLGKKIEQQLQTEFGFQIAVIVRAAREMQSLIKADPFRKVKVTPQTRLVVTFLDEGGSSDSDAPKQPALADFGAIRVSEGEVCSTFELAPKRGTSDLMKVLEKEFGKRITTRTWNTVQRIAKLCR
jgi:uncharacterized protein (DUF1697 family)